MQLASCIAPGKYLVVDESMNQWLGNGMPNLKKVPRKPHPIGQEFKTLADHHSYCILQMDTVSNTVSKEYDNEPGMKKLAATIKRLVKPWFGSGRTVIADSWFGSPDMTAMLSDLGLYSIMQVTKRRYWPRGMPVTDIVEQLEPAHCSSHYTMKKNSSSRTLFVCSYRDRRVKAFISSCGTTSRLDGQRTSVSYGSLEVAVSHPNFVNEYETHKSK
ncbi:phosphatidylinositol-binding protein scs2, variant 2 [Mucor circinelloides]